MIHKFLSIKASNIAKSIVQVIRNVFLGLFVCLGRDFEELEKLGGDFIQILKEFFETNKDNNKWVGVSLFLAKFICHLRFIAPTV